MIKLKTFSRKSEPLLKNLDQNQEQTRLDAEAFVRNTLNEENVIHFSESAVILPDLISFNVCTTVWYKEDHGG